MPYMRSPPKAITICFREKIRFDCKNNYRYNKLANFC